MEKVVNWINQNAVNELETLLSEGIGSDENLPDLIKSTMFLLIWLWTLVPQLI